MRRPLFWERFNARLVPDPESGCVLWTGRLNKAGYGVIRMDGREQQVHRVTWELEVGPVPDDMELDHVLARGCVHRNCANVAHLEPVTHRENLLRAPNSPAAINAAKTHCKHGHAFDEENTRPHMTAAPGRGRRCKTGDRIRNLAFYRHRNIQRKTRREGSPDGYVQAKRRADGAGFWGLGGWVDGLDISYKGGSKSGMRRREPDAQVAHLAGKPEKR